MIYIKTSEKLARKLTADLMYNSRYLIIIWNSQASKNSDLIFYLGRYLRADFLIYKENKSHRKKFHFSHITLESIQKLTHLSESSDEYHRFLYTF